MGVMLNCKKNLMESVRSECRELDTKIIRTPTVYVFIKIVTLPTSIRYMQNGS